MRTLFCSPRGPWGAALLVGRLWAVCALLPVSDLSFAETDRQELSGVHVAVAGNQHKLIALEARQAPLKRVIDELAGKTGTRVHYSFLPDEQVTAQCVGTTVKEVLGCLLGADADLVSRSSGGSPGQQPEVWVLASSFAKRQPFEAEPDAGEPLAIPKDTGQEAKPAPAEDPAQRAQAIARLAADGQADDDGQRRALEDALADPDAQVRAQAVYGLAQRGGADASAALQAGLHDSDASVRLMAVDSVGLDPQGLALLQQALADSDETVSAMAALKLESLVNQASAP